MVVLAWMQLSQAAEPTTLAELDQRGRVSVERVAAVEASPVVLANGTVMTAAGQVWPKGYVVLREGRIVAVGEGDAPAVEGALVVDVSGRFVTPGLIDTHSHLGVYPAPGAAAHADGNEMTAPTTAGVWAEHSLWPQDPGFQLAIEGGVTALQILPGSANLIGGRGVVVRPIPARGSRAMRFPGAPETVKLACGENPKRVYGEKGGPQTRMGNLRGQREAFLAAEAYQRKWAEWAEKSGHPGSDEPRKRGKEGSGDPPLPPDRDLDLETLVGVLEGDVLPQIHCYMADDMLSMLQVADEFGFEIRSFHHATEAYKVRDVLAERNVGASVWADWWGFKLEAYDAIPEGAALLSGAGVTVALHSDSGIGIQRLNQEAAKAMYAGIHAGLEIDDDTALRWITAGPAWILGIDDQTGTLEVGKRGDVVVWSARPFSVLASADLVFVDGALRWDRAAPVVWSDFLLGQGVTP